jgi:ComF family protein
LVYDFPVASMIQAFKYGHRLEVGSALSEIWLDQVLPGPLPDLLVPMPLHPARLKERGFNQALELARTIATEYPLLLDRDACRRIRDTPPQTALPLKARRKNLRGAFTARTEQVAGKRIAIVDDVMTSGSSLNELAGTLKKAGAVEVECWVMARAVRPA